MRFAVFVAALTVGACATAVPRPSCGCEPPPEPPLPYLNAAGDAELAVAALETGCLGRPTPPGLTDALMRRAMNDGWLRVAPAAAGAPCTLEVEGPPARIAATDAALLTWAEARSLTWNVRDSTARGEAGREIRRTRGEHGEGEPEMTWRFVEAGPASAAVTTLRVEWSPYEP